MPGETENGWDEIKPKKTPTKQAGKHVGKRSSHATPKNEDVQTRRQHRHLKAKPK